MAHKMKFTEDEFMSIIDRAMTAADQPLQEMIFDDAELNVDWDVLPPLPAVAPAKPAGNAGVIASTLPLTGTHPICIRVPARVIRAFQAQAAKSSTGYQTLMNSALKEATDAHV